MKMKSAFFEVRIYYEDTDAGGVVYYANYLKYFERARTEWFRDAGVDAAEWAAKGVQFAVAEARLNYKSPAKLGEVVVVETRLSDMGGASLVFDYSSREKNSGRAIVEGVTKLCCLGEDFRPRRIPEEIAQKLK